MKLFNSLPSLLLAGVLTLAACGSDDSSSVARPIAEEAIAPPSTAAATTTTEAAAVATPTTATTEAATITTQATTTAVEAVVIDWENFDYPRPKDGCFATKYESYKLTDGRLSEGPISGVSLTEVIMVGENTLVHLTCSAGAANGDSQGIFYTWSPSGSEIDKFATTSESTSFEYQETESGLNIRYNEGLAGPPHTAHNVMVALDGTISKGATEDISPTTTTTTTTPPNEATAACFSDDRVMLTFPGVIEPGYSLPAEITQQRLANLGFDPGTMDGYFGRNSIDALEAWAESIDLARSIGGIWNRDGASIERPTLDALGVTC